jgi:hypothetical protein
MPWSLFLRWIDNIVVLDDNCCYDRFAVKPPPSIEVLEFVIATKTTINDDR